MQPIKRLTDAQAQTLFANLTGKSARLIRMADQYQPEAWQTASGSDHMQILREPANPCRGIARTMGKDYPINLPEK